MIKNNVFMKHLKRSLAVALVLVVSLTLSACSNSADKNPFGGLDTDSVYATSNGHSITVGELYNELRHNSLGFLNQKMEETAFKDYLEKVPAVTDATDEQKELVAEYILTDIYESYDEDVISEMLNKTKTTAVKKYIDTMYLEGYEISFKNAEGKDYNPETIEAVLGSSAFNILWDEYKIQLAKYNYAVDVLTKEMEEHNKEAAKDEDKEDYFTDAAIAEYIDNNYKYKEDLSAVVIRFMNQDEVDNVLKKFGIKIYNGEWYLVTPPKDDLGNIDYSKWTNESKYNEYYDDYSVSQSGTSSDAPISILGSETTILKIYVEIYNYIYTYRNQLTYSGQITNVTDSNNNTLVQSDFLYYYNLMLSIIEQDATNNSLVTFEELVTVLSEDTKNTSFTKEKLDTYSTSLTTYLHDTLRTTPETDDDGEELEFTRYTASARSYNNNYYLMFKLTDAIEEDFYSIEEDEDGEEYYDFTGAKELMYEGETSYYDQTLTELFNEAITADYITSKAALRMKNLTVEIYDSVLEFYYAQNNSDHKISKAFDKNFIAKISFKDDEGNKWSEKVSVDDTYKFLESIHGPQTAIALLFNKYIENSDYYKDEIENKNDYKDVVYATLTNFAADAYASYGYPSSIGKYAFMKNYYRAENATIDEAIHYLMLQEGKRQFFLDIDDSFYSSMEAFTNHAYTDFYSLTLTNILVYVDMDEDGKPDTDWFGNDDDSTLDNGLTAVQKDELANDLIKDIIKYAEFSTVNLATTFTNVVEEFNSTTRVVPTGDESLAGTKESYWAKYRRHGLYISTDTLGEYTNTSELEDDIQAKVKDLYENSEIIYNNEFSGAYLIKDETFTTEANNGHNLLLVTSGTAKTEIDMDSEDEDSYKSVPIRIEDSYKIYDLVSTDVTANLTQIEVYCREYFTTGSSTSLSASASAYLEAYLNPVLTKFNSEVVQLMIMKNTLGDITFNTSNVELNESFNKYVGYLQRTSDSYNTTITDGTNDFWYFVNSLDYSKGGNN